MKSAGQQDAELTPRRRELRRLIAEQDKSGQSIREFARFRGLKAETFYWWRREFRRNQDGFGRMPAAPDFVPVRVVDDPRPTAVVGALRIVIESGRRVIDVPHDFDADHLRRLIVVMSS